MLKLFRHDYQLMHALKRSHENSAAHLIKHECKKFLEPIQEVLYNLFIYTLTIIHCHTII